VSTSATEEKKGNRRELDGTVVSDKMDKTVVIRVERTFRHPVYTKVVRTSKKYYVHDEKNEAKEGDAVRIVESAPISKLKRWQLIKILKKPGATK